LRIQRHLERTTPTSGDRIMFESLCPIWPLIGSLRRIWWTNCVS
jgi:hypothetical protein